MSFHVRGHSKKKSKKGSLQKSFSLPKPPLPKPVEVITKGEVTVHKFTLRKDDDSKLYERPKDTPLPCIIDITTKKKSRKKRHSYYGTFREPNEDDAVVIVQPTPLTIVETSVDPEIVLLPTHDTTITTTTTQSVQSLDDSNGYDEYNEWMKLDSSPPPELTTEIQNNNGTTDDIEDDVLFNEIWRKNNKLAKTDISQLLSTMLAIEKGWVITK